MLKKCIICREGHPYPQKGHFDTIARSVWAECIIRLLLRYPPLLIYAEPFTLRARIFHCLGVATWFAPIFHWSERVNWSCGLILAQICTGARTFLVLPSWQRFTKAFTVTRAINRLMSCLHTALGPTSNQFWPLLHWPFWPSYWPASKWPRPAD